MRILFSPSKWLRKLTVPQKLYLIVGMSALILVFELASFWFTLNITSSIRAYVGGEGLWSKGQKAAIADLLHYSTTLDQADYDAFLSNLNVPLGDKKARLELDKPDPDYALVREGFLEGGNHPDDIPGMISLFRDFRHLGYMETAIDIWSSGDAKIQELRAIGTRMNTIIRSTNGAPGYAEAFRPVISSLTREALALDAQLTMLEKDFSGVLGEASREISDILFTTIIALTILLSLIGFYIAYSLSKIMTRTDKAKSEFVSLASHQLRTPLTAISWSTEHLMKDKSDPVSPNQRQALEQIHESNSRMITLVNTLLSLSSVDLGMFKMKPVPTDMRALTHDIVSEVRAQSVPKGILVIEDYGNGPHMLLADPDMFRMVIQNIVVNAIHYTPKGGTVMVRLRNIMGNETVAGMKIRKDSLLFSVSDTGCGIPKDQQGKIFSKLFRAENAQSKHTDGTGLGLYIAKAVVTAMNGLIWFTSQENKGTTFYVSVPIGHIAQQGAK
jgi:signal transduction histidine kinase